MDREREKRFGDRNLAALGLERKTNVGSPVSSQRQEAVSVDKAVNFPLQSPNTVNGPYSDQSGEKKCFPVDICNTLSGSREHSNDGEDNLNEAVISYIDDDDDQGSVFPNGDQSDLPEVLRNKPALFGLKNEMFKNSSQHTPNTRNFENFLMRHPASAVSADLDDPIPVRNNGIFDKLEYPEMHQQQQRAPPPTFFGRACLNGANGEDDFGHRERSRSRRDFRSSNQDLQDEAKYDGEKRSGGDLYSTRTGKVMRRKQREDKSVKRSEEIEGYRGNDEVENVLAYIEGTDPVKKPREEHGKRTKKKSGGSVDHGNGMQKKEKAISPTNLDIEPTATTTAESKATSALETADMNYGFDNGTTVKPTSDENQPEMELSSDAALAERLQLEELALPSLDLPSSMSSVAMDEKAKFVTVSTRKQKQIRTYDRIFRASRYKRATTPPPAASGKPVAPVPLHLERQRRNSFDYSFSALSNVISAITSISAVPANTLVKEPSIVSSTSSCSVRAKTCVGATSEVATIVSHTVLDNADSEFNNASFSSADGEMAAGAVKMSYANVAAAVSGPRANQDCGKGGLKSTENQDKALRKDPMPNSDPVGNVQPISIPMTPDAKTQSSIGGMDVKSPVEFPSLSSSSSIATVPGGNAGESEKQSGNELKAVSLPPPKVDVGKEVDGMDFIYVSTPTTAESANRNDDGISSDNQPVQNQSPAMTGVLKMLFDAFKNSDPSGGVSQSANTSVSGLSIKSDGNSGPAVQFMGSAAPLSGSSYNFSFIFGETEDDKAINEVMSRSVSVTAQPTKEDPMNSSGMSLDAAMGYDGNMPGNGDHGVENYRLTGMPPAEEEPPSQKDKTCEEMEAFAQEAWSNFVRDGNYVVYEPGKSYGKY